MAHMYSDENQTPVWLDCDPGKAREQHVKSTNATSLLAAARPDDAFAILVAAHHPALKLLGISTVHGNAPLKQTTTNAGSVLTAIGREDIPVHPGAAKPLCRKAVHAPDIHGDSGIDGTDLLPKPASAPITNPSAIEAMRTALVSQLKGDAYLVATGALTNVALLMMTYPELISHIKGLSIMGGAIGPGFSEAPMGHAKGERFGNTTNYAEFNIYCDPEAAQSIFSNPELAAKTTLIPLQLTHQVLATQKVQEQLLYGYGSSLTAQAAPSTLRQMLHDLLTFFAHTYSDVFGLPTGPPLHDPVAVAVILFDQANEDLRFDDRGGERWQVEVICEGFHSDLEEEHEQLGRTVVKKLTGSRGGVRIPRTLDVQRFWTVIEQCVQRAESRLASRDQAI